MPECVLVPRHYARLPTTHSPVRRARRDPVPEYGFVLAPANRLSTRTALLPKASTTPSNPSYHSPNLANLRVNARVAHASRVLVSASRGNNLKNSTCSSLGTAGCQPETPVRHRTSRLAKTNLFLPSLLRFNDSTTPHSRSVRRRPDGSEIFEIAYRCRLFGRWRLAAGARQNVRR